MSLYLATDPVAEQRAALRAEREQIERDTYVKHLRLAEIRRELAALPPEEGDHW
ncbi:hypothetical protein [Pseudonocardia parietis]|uniref:Uncharacterized protein involved in exopolysaccharide biosynthesis n=1 Tax=Pseudonocardia parietis TaxID=570936 RepID=A0ABS4W3M3_9PSEU|nr:hypothetical protein [Pseudonocardia parietis]MBP2370284.1 uncharacterized protein involved in exopolysaccharide biosynthesis [Pseudonocardia parietis]